MIVNVILAMCSVPYLCYFFYCELILPKPKMFFAINLVGSVLKNADCFPVCVCFSHFFTSSVGFAAARSVSFNSKEQYIFRREEIRRILADQLKLGKIYVLRILLGLPYNAVRHQMCSAI